VLLSEPPQIHNLTSKLFARGSIQRDINTPKAPSTDHAFCDNILTLEQLLESVFPLVVLAKTVYLLLSFLDLISKLR